MRLLTRESDYAARALSYLAINKDRFCSSTEIAKAEKVSVLFMRRILVKLVSMGLIESKEGIGGGVKLAKDPKKIKLYDLIKEFQGEIVISECLLKKNICHNRAKCVLRHRLSIIERKLLGEIEKITINELAEGV